METLSNRSGSSTMDTLRRAAEHYRDVHNVEVISSDLARRVQNAIHEE